MVDMTYLDPDERRRQTWLEKLFGDDVHFSPRSYVIQIRDNRAMESLPEFRKIGTLMLVGSQITDAELAQVKGLTQLENLSIEDTQVTDAGLEHIKRLTQLHSLSLENAPITDAGLQHITRLARLEELTLKDTPITDAGLQHLEGLIQLQSCRSTVPM